jgi:hypothetical protein
MTKRQQKGQGLIHLINAYKQNPANVDEYNRIVGQEKSERKDEEKKELFVTTPEQISAIIDLDIKLNNAGPIYEELYQKLLEGQN